MTVPAEFGRVAVLMGGWSSEREVSLWSGEKVLAALRARGIDADGVDADKTRVLHLREEGFVRAFNLLHGTGGEDGTVQAALDLQGIAYPGCGVLTAALAMDKLQTKRVWQAMDLPTPAYRVLPDVAAARAAGDEMGYPFIIKPTADGSSVGITKVHDQAEIEAAFLAACGGDAPDGTQRPREVMAESFVAGGEYTCAVLDEEALPLIRIEPDGEFYDYNAKYLSDNTRYVCPVDLDPQHEIDLRGLCLEAWRALGGHGWGRVDFMLDASGQPWLVEANTVPGMTAHSLVPMAAQAAGMDFQTLCWAILETSLDRDPGTGHDGGER